MRHAETCNGRRFVVDTCAQCLVFTVYCLFVPAPALTHRTALRDCSLQSPVARTVAHIVDSSYVGSPVILLLATADLAVTTANGVLQKLVAGGFVIKITSQATFDAANSAMESSTLRKRERDHQRNALLDSWVELRADDAPPPQSDEIDGVFFELIDAEADKDDAEADKDDDDDEEAANDDENGAAAVAQHVSFADLDTLESALLADPTASVCIVPVRNESRVDGTSSDDGLSTDELELSREDAAKLLKAIRERSQEEKKDSTPIAVMSQSVLVEKM